MSKPATRTYTASDGTLYLLDSDALIALPENLEPIYGAAYRDGDMQGLMVDVTVSRHEREYVAAGPIWKEVYEHLRKLPA
jgi:hypothetical protein